MKKEIRSYLSFTRAERTGLVCLCALLLVLIGARATMYLWVLPPGDNEKNTKLATGLRNFENNAQQYDRATAMPKKDFQDTFDENTAPLPDSINLNTADSAMLVRLKGIGPATASKIIARRKKHHFSNVSELMQVRHFPEQTFELLKQHLYVANAH
jgi:hypothetical protein